MTYLPGPQAVTVQAGSAGAFVLAATGLLDELRATTHWFATGRFAEPHPAIDVFVVQAPSRSEAPPRGGTLGLTALTAAAPVTWGTTYLVTTVFLPPGHPLVSGVIRALPAGLILLAFTRRLPRGEWLWRSPLLGTLNIGAFFALLFVAAYRLPGGVAATIGAVQPLLVACLAFLLLGERPTCWRLGWGAVGVAGVGLIVLRGQFSLDLLGILAGLAAVGVMGVGIVLTKRWGRPEGAGAATIAGWQLTAGGLVLMPFALAFEGLQSELDLPAIAGYLWLSLVGALLAYLVWFNGIGRLPVVAVSFLALLSPAVATILGWLSLGESLTPWQAVGFVLALAAIAAAQLNRENGVEGDRMSDFECTPCSAATRLDRPGLRQIRNTCWLIC